ncbi:ROK family protein [Roseomonas haemaphysalidis]|uniref:ROK family protein n=1 Tax=Roseomonas haemaphysalidis TaxID=2768162 RepID=A0ABS3KMW9_9PROT|nr:ROK family protein [Roseomonas haemaphysalidis]MBO1078811.1 ROK family protein [Roseomonas haemaphysalidis]
MLCADIGGSFLKFGILQADGTLRPAGRVPTPARDRDAFVLALRRFADDAPGVPLALSLAGTVDPDSGTAQCANIPCLNGRPLAAQLAAALNRPVRIDNDADCFAFAEATRGAGQGHRVVFGIILGSGVGGGLVADGRLVRGAGGVGGEWGHGPVAMSQLADGTAVPRFPCGCGQRGCADSFGSARGLERLHAALGGAALSSPAIVQGWRDGDAAAGRSVAAWVEMLSGPLAMAVNLCGASVVPVGGGLSNAPDLIAALDAAVRARILRRTAEPLLRPSSFPDTAGLLGAAMLAAHAA